MQAMVAANETSGDRFLFSDSPEQDYASLADRQRQKELGQFFTPYPIAGLMARWLLHGPHPRRILDPAIGLGIFIRALIESGADQVSQAHGYDIDIDVLARCRTLFAGLDFPLELIHKDYLQNGWSDSYDGIVCNPPYQRFQNYANRQILISDLEQKLSFSLSGLTNLHNLFLLKSLQQVSTQGRVAYIMPSEFMNSDYGVRMKSYLLKDRSLRYIIVFDFDHNVFDNALTTACILLFANDGARQGVEFIKVKSVAELQQIQDELLRYPHNKALGDFYAFPDLDPEIKWRSYYDRLEKNPYRNLIPFSTYAKVMRGIATGANEYFTFNQTKMDRWEIPPKNLLPCLTKAVHARSAFFTVSDFEQLRCDGKRIYLFDARQAQQTAVQNYLKHGKGQGVHLKYLTSHRDPWYKIEQRPPAPILVNVFNRAGLRFVRNEAGVHNLTCFHATYPSRFLPDLDLFMAYLLTDVARKILSANRREYGDGLRKYEPNDINNSQVLNLDVLSDEQKQRIHVLYAQYRQSILGKEPDSEIVHQIEQVFLQVMVA